MPITKSLLILGHPRSGKTTLGDMICDRFNLSFISIDSLVYTFGKIFPELGLHYEPERSESALAPFLFMYMDRIKHKSVYRNFIVEGCHISPKTANSMMNKDKYKLIVLGCPNLTPEQYAANIRKYDKSFDWTVKKDDSELLQIATSSINTAWQMKLECDEIGIKFIDTSFERGQKLKDFVEDLDNFLFEKSDII